MSEVAGDEAFDPPSRRYLLRIWRALTGPQTPPSYWLARSWFLRGLGLVYLVAFLVAASQLPALVGQGGLSPVDDHLARVAADAGSRADAFASLPTLFWVGSSDGALLAASWVGAALSLLLLAGVSHPVQLLVLWALYLSIDHIGQRFYSFGWESQLLETGFLAVFLVPCSDWRAFPRTPPPTVVVVLLRWLVFRIMLGAGLIKLRGDPCWTELTCLDFHFETQPIPHPLSWLFHHLPRPLLHAGVAANHVVELVLPFFVFGPRRLRHLAGASMIAFQGALILSGNLAFLNWLTILPCLACFDDSLLRRVTPRALRRGLLRPDRPRATRPTRVHTAAATLFAAVVAWLSLPVLSNLLSGERQAMNRSYDRIHLVNTYGAFGSVGDERWELVIEGTADEDPDRAHWLEYEFRCKPGDPARPPCWITPYHRRLDWLMWFAALEAQHTGGLQREDWVLHLLYKLLTGDRRVEELLDDTPFPASPPRFVRVSVYRYRFTDPGEEGWWRRERLGTLVRPVSADDEELLAYLRQRGWL